MSEDPKSIHEFDFELICEYFSTLERQGPGSPEVTLKALSFVVECQDIDNSFVCHDIADTQRIYRSL